MTHVTCKLTAKNRDQLRNPTLGNRLWAAFLIIGDVSDVAAVSCLECGQTQGSSQRVRVTDERSQCEMVYDTGIARKQGSRARAWVSDAVERHTARVLILQHQGRLNQ